MALFCALLTVRVWINAWRSLSTPPTETQPRRGANRSSAPLSRQRAFDGGLNMKWNAVSGFGSAVETQGPLLTFLPGWLAKNGIRSMTEASSGHWASGWQRHVRWPRIDYVGADVLKSIVDANRRVEVLGAGNFIYFVAGSPSDAEPRSPPRVGCFEPAADKGACSPRRHAGY